MPVAHAMTMSLNNGLVGLSLLANNSNVFATFGAAAGGASGGTAAPTNAAVTKAEAAFTLAPTTPPWPAVPVPTSSSAASAQLATILAAPSVVDPSQAATMPPDVAIAFTTYRALDQLNSIATVAADPTSGTALRAQLQTAFAKGLGDLQAYLAATPGANLNLAFATLTSTAKSVAIPQTSDLSVPARTVVAQRADPIAALSGTEQFTVKLDRLGAHDTVNVNLAGGPQPPTLDSIAGAINSAITAITLTNPDGTPQLDTNGQPIPRWSVRFQPQQTATGWGLAIANPGEEQVAIQQVNAPDALYVAAGQTTVDQPGPVTVTRFGLDAAGAVGTRATLASYGATNDAATARAQAAQTSTTGIGGIPLPPPQVPAALSANAILTAPDGGTYILGRAEGTVGSDIVTSGGDLVLTRLDSEGRVTWQHALGAQDATGAALALAPDGSITVAGTVAGALGSDGSTDAGDMLIAHISAAGADLGETRVLAPGVQAAQSVVTLSDGSSLIAGNDASGGTQIARVDATGNVTARRSFTGTGMPALAVAANGTVMTLRDDGGHAFVGAIDPMTLADVGTSVDLGQADARAMAVAADGSVVVAGATSATIAGPATNAPAGGRDGFVTRLSPDLGTSLTTYVGSAGTDQIDSIALGNGTIQVGGRTDGALSGNPTGATDGFVATLDQGTMAIGAVRQFGTPGAVTAPVQVALAPGGDNVLGALGLARGALIPSVSPLLTDQTTVRAGDRFTVAVDGAAAQTVTIDAGETMASLAQKVATIVGPAGSALAATQNGAQALQITAGAGHAIALMAGPAGNDALVHLGMGDTRLDAPPAPDANAPVVTPGGSFTLDLSPSLAVDTAADATAALGQIAGAISSTQSAYRSLYWDDTKAQTVTSAALGSGTVSAYDAAQAGRYQAALDRLTAGTTGTAPTPTTLGGLLAASMAATTTTGTTGTLTSLLA